MLNVKDLRKVYGSLVAVEGISFSLAPGDIFGFIGSNGAGKTTTIKMIATLLEPTSGTAEVNGCDIWKDPMGVRMQIGYMPDFFGLYDDVTAYEYLDFFATVYRVPIKQRHRTIIDVLELTDLTAKRHAFVQSLSRGMQQRLCLAKCLIHDPHLLLLDEPASGLDPRARAELKELILELGKMGKIVVVSSHILPELSGFCNMVGIIEKGRLLTFGAVDSVVRELHPHRQIEVRALRDGDRLRTWLNGRPMVEEAVADGDGRILLKFSGELEDQAELVSAIVAQGFPLIEFTEQQANLEDVFLKLSAGEVN